jgi:hypothetical protein
MNKYSILKLLAIFLFSTCVQSKELDWLADQTLCMASAPGKFFRPDGRSDLARLRSAGIVSGPGRLTDDKEESFYDPKIFVTLFGYPIKSFVLFNRPDAKGMSLVVDLNADIDGLKAKIDDVLTDYTQAGPFVSRFHSVPQDDMVAYARSVKYNSGSLEQERSETIGTFRVYLTSPRAGKDRRTSIYCAVEKD